MDIHINNRKRLVRFLNKENESNNNGDKLLYDNVIFVGLTTDRENLYKRIDDRVDEMIKLGLVEEVKYFYDNKINSKATNTAIGYKELYQYFDGKISLDEAIDLIKKNTRHFIKRQYTFFKHQMDVNWITTDFNNFNNTINEAIKIIN